MRRDAAAPFAAIGARAAATIAPGLQVLKELLHRSAWLAAGSAVGRLLPLAVLVWASRHFAAAQFASAGAGFAWAGIAMSLTSSGEATVMTQRLGAQKAPVVLRGLYLRHASRSLLLAALLTLAVCIYGQAGAHFLFGAAIDGAVVIPAALSGALWSQVAMCVAAMNGCHAPRRASITMAVCGVLQGLGMLTGLALLWSAEAMVWGLAIGSGLALAVALLQLRRTLGPLHRDLALARRASLEHTTRRTLAFNPVLWNTVASISVLPVTFFASSLIAKGPDGMRQLAQYFALEQVHQVLVYLPAMIGQALLPLISRRTGGLGDAMHTAAFMRRMARVSLVSAVAGTTLALLLGWSPLWLVDLLKNPSLVARDSRAIAAMLVNASLALSLSLLGGVFVGCGNIVVAAGLNLMWGGIVIAFTALWVGEGNFGLQAARVLASGSLILFATLLLLTYPHWASRPGTNRSTAP